jgi:hypothetical protein
MEGKIHKEKRKKEYVCHPYHHICDDRTKEKGKRMDKKKKNLSHPNTRGKSDIKKQDAVAKTV